MPTTVDAPAEPNAYLSDLDARMGEDTAALPLGGAEEEVYEESLQERFERFHAENPHVYEGLRELAKPLARLGQPTSIKMLWEVLRYQELVRTEGDVFVLNNSYTSRYARLLMDQEPDLRGLFKVRELRS